MMPTRLARPALLLVALSCLQCGRPAPRAQAGAEARSADRRRWDAEVGRLAAALRTMPSDIERTTFLREYVGRLVDLGRLDAGTQRRYRALNFDSFDPAEFYPLFEDDRLPADCGITSFFYVKLLHAVGYKAYQYSFGFTAAPDRRFIHSVALVDVDTPDGRRLIVQDAYLDLTYRDERGKPLDFFDLLSALERKDYRHVVMDPGSVTTLLLVPDTSLYYPHLSAPCRAAMAGALTRPDGTLEAALPVARDYATLMQAPCDGGGFENGFIAALRRHGFMEPFVYAYALRAADLVGSPDHDALQRRIDAARPTEARLRCAPGSC